jgi:transcriptional regulator with XRE-family HTH domain
MKTYREFPAALRRVIAITNAGNQSNFAEKSGLTAASVSRLCAGTREITKETLEKISAHLPDSERQRLYAAALHDFLPDDAQRMFLHGRKNDSDVMREEEAEYPAMDPETRRILEWLYRKAQREEEVRVWLRTLAKWIMA